MLVAATNGKKTEFIFQNLVTKTFCVQLVCTIEFYNRTQWCVQISVIYSAPISLNNAPRTGGVLKFWNSSCLLVTKFNCLYFVVLFTAKWQPSSFKKNAIMVTVINDQIILEEEYDENYQPTEEGTFSANCELGPWYRYRLNSSMFHSFYC